MKEVRIEVVKLTDIITKNRTEHREIFLKAQEKYREKVILALDEQLKAARDGNGFDLRNLVQLTPPSDHTSDYDRALKMLELSVDGTVVLSTADFSNLVQDQWDWSRSWAASNSRYTDSPKFRSLMD